MSMPEKKQTFFWWMMSFTRLQRARSTAALFDYCASSWNLTWKCLCSPDVRSMRNSLSAPNWHFPKSSSSSTQSRFEDSSYCEKKIHSRLPWHPLLMELFRVRRICNYFITHPSSKIFCEHFAPQIWVTHNLISSGVLNFAGNSKCCHTRSLAWN